MADKNPHEIEYTVNDEPQSTTEKTLTPVKIMEKAGVDPETNYLIEIRGKEQFSYKDKPTEEIHMHPKIKFITNFFGPTQVAA